MANRLVTLTAALGLAAGLSNAVLAGEESASRRSSASSEDPPPDGVQMLMKRGGIPAVFEPAFVGADVAEITDDAWILGIVIDGTAKAYSLNLLNHHEVVNDRFGDRPVAAVW